MLHDLSIYLIYLSAPLGLLVFIIDLLRKQRKGIKPGVLNSFLIAMGIVVAFIGFSWPIAMFAENYPNPKDDFGEWFFLFSIAGLLTGCLITSLGIMLNKTQKEN